jgi:catechol 2,3-dioxygenase-like lactoylglutathione lyase family enzyme
MMPHKPSAFCLLFAFTASAQLPSPGAHGIIGTHIQLNSADTDAAIVFWKDVMGTSTSGNEAVKGVNTLGVTILFTKKAPTGPSVGSAIDHLAFHVPDLQPFVDRIAKTPFKTFHPEGDELRLMVDGPDGVRIEMIEDSSMYASQEFHHIHMYSAQAKEMQEWYVKNLGGRSRAPENADMVQFPGTMLRFQQAGAAVPTAGRAVDHIAFEVKDLDGFCKKLTDNGVKLDSAPHAVPELKASVAVLTDPWGTRIELMETTGN